MPFDYTADDIFLAYKSLGIRDGDTLFVTSSFGFLGRLMGANSQDEVCALHLQTLLDIIGPSGTLIVPTYSYTFGSSTPSQLEIFDPLVTPSSIGPLPNYVIGTPGFTRTNDPMMSVSIFGHHKSLGSSLPSSSYGRDSIFERLLSVSAKCLSIGLGPNWTPFIHYLDHIVNVDYRYEKIFNGILRLDSVLHDISWLYSVPIRSRLFSGNCQKLGFLSTKNQIWRQSSLGKGSLYIADYCDYFNFSLDLFSSHRRLTVLASERLSIIESEDSRRKSLLNSTDINSDISFDFYVQDSYTSVSNKSLSSLFQFLSTTIHKCYIDHFEIFTGSTINGYVVPESWVPLSFSIYCQDGSILFTHSNSVNLSSVFLPHSSSNEGRIDSLSVYDSSLVDMTEQILLFSCKKSISVSSSFYSYILQAFPYAFTYKFQAAHFYSSVDIVCLHPISSIESDKILCINSLPYNLFSDANIIQSFLDQNFIILYAPLPLSSSIFQTYYSSHLNKFNTSYNFFCLDSHNIPIPIDYGQYERLFIRSRLAHISDTPSLKINTLNFTIV